MSDEFDGPDALLTNTAGTPAFTPPECLQASGSQSAPFSGRAADIWSLGVTLFCLVTGYLPFLGDNVMEVYNKITNTEPQIPESLSAELTDLLEKMLVKCPLERVSLAQLKDHPWVTGYGVYPMLEEEDNCTLIEVTEDEVENSVNHIHNLDTLILVKVSSAVSIFRLNIILTIAASQEDVFLTWTQVSHIIDYLLVLNHL